MTISGAVIFFIVFPMYFDPGLTRVQQILFRIPSLASFSPWAVVVIITLAGVLISPLVLSLATFGEEFGWRGYLLPKLLLLGWRKTMLLMGLIWGVWHYPVIFMGYE